MNITRYDSVSIFRDCYGNWNELLADSSANHIFMTCEWMSSWWQVYQPGDLAVLVLRDEEQGRWLGVAPWFIETTAEGKRVIYTVGSVDVTDYLDIIVRRGFEDEVLAALAGWLAGHAGEFDEVRLCNIPQDSPVLEKMPALLESRGFSVTKEVAEVCPVVALPDRFDRYVEGLDKKNRHELRRKIRRATGVAEWYIAGPDHDLKAELAQFVELMAASAPSKAEFLANPLNRQFFELIVPQLARQGWLQLAFMTVGGERVASYLNFDYGNRIMVYNSGLKPGAQPALSPGIALLAKLIEYAIDQHRTEMDFLRGNESYKYDMGGHDTHIYDLVVAQPAKG